MLTISLTEKDFEDALGKKNVDIKFRKKNVDVLGKTKENDIKRKMLDALPKVLSHRISSILPDDFEIHEIQLALKIDGKLFGSGVGGEAILKFGPKK